MLSPLGNIDGFTSSGRIIMTGDGEVAVGGMSVPSARPDI